MVTKAKKFADGLVEKAQGLLCKDGYLAPVIFSIKGKEIDPILLNIKDEKDKDVIPGLLRGLSKDSDYIVMMVDSYVKPVAEKEIITGAIKNHPDSMSAIVAFLYLPDKMFIRNMTYIKNKDDRFNFFDQGWEEVFKGDVSKCRFSNPFDTLECAEF
jgi:hypothetical protein